MSPLGATTPATTVTMTAKQLEAGHIITVRDEKILPPLPTASTFSTINTIVPSTPPAYSRRPFLTRLKTRWIFLRQRTKNLIYVGLAVLIVLIVGLAAGLGTSSHRTSNLALPSSHGGPYTGDLTYYEPGMGACGVSSSSSDAIVAVSHVLFDAVSTGSNPNANPLCGKKVRIRREGKSIDVKVVDRCVGCKQHDLDVTQSTFGEMASVDQGRVTMSWAWLEDVPSDASIS